MALAPTSLFPSFSANGDLTKGWSYTTLDPLATVATAGYFNGVASSLGIGDTITVAVVDAMYAASRTTLINAAILIVSANDGTNVTTKTFAAGV